MTLRHWLAFVLVAVLAAGAGAWVSSEWKQRYAVPQADASLLGQQRPPFTLGAADGRRVSAYDFDGQVLLVNFWATWCEPCRKEMPMLDVLHQQYQQRGLSIVGIAIDDVQRAREFARDLGIDYTILVGGADVMATGLAYGNSVGALPYSVLVDRDGVVRWAKLGELKRQDLLEQILPLL